MVDKPLHIFEDRNVLYINVRCTLDPNGMFKEDEGRLGFLRTHIYEDGQLHTPYGPVVWSNLEPQQQCIASRAFGAKNDAPWLVCRHVGRYTVECSRYTVECNMYIVESCRYTVGSYGFTVMNQRYTVEGLVYLYTFSKLKIYCIILYKHYRVSVVYCRSMYYF